MNEFSEFWRKPVGKEPIDDPDRKYLPHGADYLLKRGVNRGRKCKEKGTWIDGTKLVCVLVVGHDGPHLGRDRWNGLKAWEVRGE